MSKRISTLSIVIPCYNEQSNIPILYREILQRVDDDLKIEFIFIDDGSVDGTADLLTSLSKHDSRVNAIIFSRNFGHQAALRAGLDHASGDAVLMMDGDMQHPPALIPRMLAAFEDGNDIINMIRQDQNRYSVKSLTSRFFYTVINLISNTRVYPGASDFRLMSIDAVHALRSHIDRRVFIRGIVPTIGFQQINIAYVPDDRLHGVSGYTFRKMIRLARDGIVSTTTKPLRFALYMGLIIGFVLVIYLLFVLYAYFLMDDLERGWSSLMVVLLTVSSLNFLTLGIIGEYIAKLVDDTSRRPIYIIRESTLMSKPDVSGPERTRSESRSDL